MAFFAFDFGYLVTMITDSLKTSNTALTTLITAVLNIVFGAVSVLLISFVYLFFVNYAMFLFIDDSNSNVFCCFGKGVKMFVKNFGNTMKLYFVLPVGLHFAFLWFRHFMYYLIFQLPLLPLQSGLYQSKKAGINYDSFSVYDSLQRGGRS